MKIFVFAFSLIFVYSYSNWAVAACSDYTTQATCPAGCEFTVGAGCASCADGTYTDTAGETSCQVCNKPNKASFTTNGTSVDGCSWTVTCTAGKYWDGDSCENCTGNNFSTDNTVTGTGGASQGANSCTACGNNSTANTGKKGCTCDDGYHTDGQDQTHTDNNSTDCVERTYTVTYDMNCAGGSGSVASQSVKYKAKFTTQSNAFTCPGKTFDKWDNSRNGEYEGIQEHTYATAADTTLKAKWTDCPNTGAGVAVDWKSGVCEITKCLPTYYVDGTGVGNSCKPCTEGNYCKDGIKEEICPKGYYCPGGGYPTGDDSLQIMTIIDRVSANEYRTSSLDAGFRFVPMLKGSV